MCISYSFFFLPHSCQFFLFIVVTAFDIILGMYHIKILADNNKLIFILMLFQKTNKWAILISIINNINTTLSK